MIDNPILFSGPMIRALIAGNKTMTRRALKQQPEKSFGTLVDRDRSQAAKHRQLAETKSSMIASTHKSPGSE